MWLSIIPQTLTHHVTQTHNMDISITPQSQLVGALNRTTNCNSACKHPQSHHKRKLSMVMISITCTFMRWLKPVGNKCYFFKSTFEKIRCCLLVLYIPTHYWELRNHNNTKLNILKNFEKKNAFQSKAVTRLCSTWRTFHLGVWPWPYTQTWPRYDKDVPTCQK